jgi:hypothetical protein
MAGACAASGANIVDAQIFTTTDGLALDTISISRAFDRDEDETRRAARVAEAIEKALRGEIRLSQVIARFEGGSLRSLTHAPSTFRGHLVRRGVRVEIESAAVLVAVSDSSRSAFLVFGVASETVRDDKVIRRVAFTQELACDRIQRRFGEPVFRVSAFRARSKEECREEKRRPFHGA